MNKETRSEQGSNGELKERVSSAIEFVRGSGNRFGSLGMLSEVAGLVNRNGNGEVSQTLVGNAIRDVLKEIGVEGFRPEFYEWNLERGEFEVKIVRVLDR